MTQKQFTLTAVQALGLSRRTAAVKSLRRVPWRWRAWAGLGG